MNSSPLSLLVVDDDPIIHDSLKLLLGKSWNMTSLSSADEKIPDLFFHAALVDMHLRGNQNSAEGPTVIQKIKSSSPQSEVVGMSGDLNMKLMEASLAAGARQFLAKPLLVAEVNNCLAKIEALWQLRQIDQRGSQDRTQWIGSSAASEEIRRQVSVLRGEKGPILISGETGSGKEVISRLLHQQEPGRPFIAVNMASLPEHLFESELFGHVRGAFTGADTNKMGLIEAAQGGDLFLDEIEALPLSQQAKLLRFLETGEIRRVGGKENSIVKTRVITATNVALEELVQKGLFRQDLLFRLKAQVIPLPPLRERLDDVTELVQFFVRQEKPRINKQWTPEAIIELKTHSWPGNVRELKRVCEQVALAAPLPFIRGSDVRPLLQKVDARPPSEDWILGLDGLLMAYEKNLLLKCLGEDPALDVCLEKLKISRSGFYKKLKDYQIEVPS